MSDFSLILGAFRNHKSRTLFTVLSVVVAFAVLMVLASLYSGVTGLVHYTRAQRSSVWAEGFGQLPLAYVKRIATIPGIQVTAYRNGMSGAFREPKNSVYVKGVSFTDYMKVFPELSLPDAYRRAMLADRLGVIAGAPLAKKYGWKTGDTIRLINGPAQRSGSTTWTFHLHGIFKSTLPDSMGESLVAHYDYINEGRADPSQKDKVDQVFFLATDARAVATVSQRIDKMFEHSSPPAMSFPDTLLYATVIKSFGDIGLIIVDVSLAVFFSMLLVTGNTIAQSVRERISEFALLRALGFGRRRLLRLVLGEAGLLIGTGACFGALLGWQLCRVMSPLMSDVLPFFSVPWQVLPIAAALAALFILLSGLLPMRQVTGLAIADSLRRV